MNYNPDYPYMRDAPVQHQDTVKMSLARVKLANILAANQGKEPNIPYNDEYWFLKNVLRSWERLEV